jgi:hypothetical protein
MKWLLLGLLIFLAVSGRAKISDLFRTARGLPKDFRAGKRAVEAPTDAAIDHARDVTPSSEKR